MRIQGKGLSAGAALVVAAALALGGCAHNDVLVFGTDTKLGIDVETGAAQGASPSVTIGYKRQEAVWMPLFVNGQDSRYAPATQATNSGQHPGPDMKYQSVQPGGRRDAYSVFASLGAELRGSAPEGQASMGLAQFFATGGAAINITENEALVTALKVETAGGAAHQADAVAAASHVRPTVIAAANRVTTETDQAMTCLHQKGTEAISAKLGTSSEADRDAKTRLKAAAEDIEIGLANNDGFRNTILAACK